MRIAGSRIEGPCWINVLLVGLGFEVRLIERSKSLKILGPNRNVFGVHRYWRVGVCDQANVRRNWRNTGYVRHNRGHDSRSDPFSLMVWVYCDIDDLKIAAAVAYDTSHANQQPLMPDTDAEQAVS